MHCAAAKLTCLKAMPPKAWVSPDVAWLIGDGKSSTEQGQGQRSIVPQQACGGQASCCWTVLDHDQVQGCQEVVDNHCHVAIQAEC